MATNTLVRIKSGNKHYEILVDLELALKLRKGEPVDIKSVLLADGIFLNHKTGTKAADADLIAAFGSSDLYAVADRIVKKGDIQLSQEYKEEQQSNKRKQVVEWLVKNAVDVKTGRPFTPQMVERALEQAKVNITNLSVDQQVVAIAETLKTILPLKIETKKLALTIPAQYTGKVYGIVNQYKEKEDWLADGSLKVIVNLPVGLQSEFYDKLNAITHGAALSEEIKS
jgi:ribosome maturation protein SDO1